MQTKRSAKFNKTADKPFLFESQLQASSAERGGGTRGVATSGNKRQEQMKTGQRREPDIIIRSETERKATRQLARSKAKATKLMQTFH